MLQHGPQPTSPPGCAGCEVVGGWVGGAGTEGAGRACRQVRVGRRHTTHHQGNSGTIISSGFMGFGGGPAYAGSAAPVSCWYRPEAFSASRKVE